MIIRAICKQSSALSKNLVNNCSAYVVTSFLAWSRCIFTSMRVILSTLIYLLTLRFRKRRSLELEIVALRHQLKILRRKRKQPARMTRGDRCVWSCIYQVYPAARHWMQIVDPITVKAWRHLGFHVGRPASKGRPGRRPKVNDKLRRLISQMYTENTGWGFARIHAELQKLGYELVEQTVRVNLPRHRSPPGPGWRTFVQNHQDGAAAINVFALITAALFKIGHTMILLWLYRLRSLARSDAERPTKNEFIGEGARTLAKFPWSISLPGDRDRCWARRVDRSTNFGIHRRIIANQLLRHVRRNGIAVAAR
jgi:hypothetical protein